MEGRRGGGGGGSYQSIDCGGSSFEGEVLTVSTQPGGGEIDQLVVHFKIIGRQIPSFVGGASYQELVAFLDASRRRRRLR